MKWGLLNNEIEGAGYERVPGSNPKATKRVSD